MANATCQDPSLSGAGILWVDSTVTDPAPLSVERFTRWYEEVHIPDVLAAGKPDKPQKPSIQAAWRYECMDKAPASAFLAVYRCPDLAFLQTAAFKAVPKTHPSLPGDDDVPVHRFAHFAARILRHVESWSRCAVSSAVQGHAQFLVSESITPTDATAAMAQPGVWCRDIRLAEVAAQPGWRHSSRFELVSHQASDNTIAATPQHMVLHEFDEAPSQLFLGALATTQTMHVATFRLLRGFGDAGADWADAETQVL